MSGYISAPGEGPDDYDGAYEAGRAHGASIQFQTTITHPDLPALLNDPSSPATIGGTVLAPVLCQEVLEIESGAFVLLEPHPKQVETDRMTYQMRLRCTSDPSRRYLLEGHKVIRVSSILAAWRQTTTLYVKVYEGDSPEPRALRALGMMHISLADVYHLVHHADVSNCTGVEREEYLARFGAMFIRSLWPFYGGVANELGRFGPGSAPQRRIPGSPDLVRLCDPKGGWHDRDEDVPDACSRLIRYRGGDKGPVMLAAGFAMSATSLHSAAHLGLAPYLADAGFDVWLFDYRAGIDLPSASGQFTVDDIAHVDWPRAVDEVLRVTGASTVQVFGHCVGSVSILMSLLDETSGMEGKVRSVVCSQFSMHPHTSKLKLIESEFYVGKILEALGVHRTRPDASRTPGHVALDVALHAIPVPKGEECLLPVCRWINAVFGLTHHHAQLDDATHLAIADLFGEANISTLDHLGLMMQKGKAVDAHGRDRYLPHVERLADVPIHFLAGRLNYIFHPSGIERTLEWLRGGGGDPAIHTMTELPNYSHLDCLIGTEASGDVFPIILDHLDRYS
jgi:cholesterol oxidase